MKETAFVNAISVKIGTAWMDEAAVVVLINVTNAWTNEMAL